MTNPIVQTEGNAVSAARILVVDDEQRILDEYAYVLGQPPALKEGQKALDDLEAELFGDREPASEEPVMFDVMTCRQGQDAVVAVEQAVRSNKPFSVVFLDVRMPPGIDGVTTAERIRALDPSINIVFVTGYSDVRPEAMAERVPPADKMIYCQKPLQASELKQFARALSAKWLAEQRLRDDAGAAASTHHLDLGRNLQQQAERRGHHLHQRQRPRAVRLRARGLPQRRPAPPQPRPPQRRRRASRRISAACRSSARSPTSTGSAARTANTAGSPTR